MWQATPPDGRLLFLRRSEAGWLASCLASRAEAPSAEEAIRKAVGAPLDGRLDTLEAWIADHVAELEGAGDG